MTEDKDPYDLYVEQEELRRKRKEQEDREDGVITLFWLVVTSSISFLLYLFYDWIDLSFTEWMLLGIFIVLILILLVTIFRK